MTARELIQRETGLDLVDTVAERAVAERMAKTGQQNIDDYLGAIGADELKALIELVVVPESWMFRDALAFSALTRFVLQRLARHAGRLVRILSVPCAGGEEPYSIAMALQDAGAKRSSTLIEAIDLSEVALARARLGRYTRNAFRGGDLTFRDRHFTPVGSDYQIKPELREQVNFSRGNLLTLDANSNAGRYDVIFCRNLLIYFDEATTAQAIAKLRTLLADDGILFAGYAEVPSFCNNGFTPLREPGSFALQKQDQASVETPSRATPKAARPVARRVVATAPAPAPTRPAHATIPLSAKPAAPQDKAAQLEQASLLAGQGDLAGAARLCHAVLAVDAAAAEAYFILGLVSECENKSAMADSHWRRCVYLQPDHYEALCHLALLAEQNGDAPQAAAFKQRAARVYQRRAEPTTRKQTR
ncbi:MAG: CheR family methyltransferase [Massilia sp.]